MTNWRIRGESMHPASDQLHACDLDSFVGLIIIQSLRAFKDEEDAHVRRLKFSISPSDIFLSLRHVHESLA